MFVTCRAENSRLSRKLHDLALIAMGRYQVNVAKQVKVFDDAQALPVRAIRGDKMSGLQQPEIPGASEILFIMERAEASPKSSGGENVRL